MPETDAPQIHWQDPERHLTFAWSGDPDDGVWVLEPGNKPLGTFPLPYPLPSVLGAVTTTEGVALFQLACRAWRRGPVVTGPTVQVASAAIDTLRKEYDRATEEQNLTGLYGAIEEFLDGTSRD